jgi:hypothetical protein
MANLYPFLSKAQIKARLDSDPGFCREVMCVLLKLQTEHEQATETTLNRNRQGFMSSHAVHGTRIAKKILSGEPLSGDEDAKVAEIAPRYSRQMACYFRARAIAEQPELAAVAALFSAG